MKFRKLKIVWSVAWGVVAVLLIVLWVRSYSVLEYVHQQTVQPSHTAICSDAGKVFLARGQGPAIFRNSTASVGPHGWEFVSRPAVNNLYNPSFAWEKDADRFYVCMPHWCLALLAVVIGGASWLPWHFSLRTLLIATTLVAVGLGLLAWAAS